MENQLIILGLIILVGVGLTILIADIKAHKANTKMFTKLINDLDTSINESKKILNKR